MGGKLKSLFLPVKSEHGRTLIEIVLSIAVLAIIIIPFTSMFVQSAKTLNVSDEIMDATYVAQTVMEEIYHLSQTTSYQAESLPSEYVSIPSEEGDKFFTILEDYYVELTMKQENTESQLVNVLTRVYNNSSKEKLEAQMETYLLWGTE
ncbi:MULTISPECIES: type IV pilus modification PilV family protein [Bacillaceae]|uniref:Prepilin-type N-terminal cleavage/methylation domain-containing protein n=1 Tax=Evansella alkalicola TaxID=745819 RepID=A0ABS6JXF9_9BACI|nr:MULTISPECIES: hypothetical protein [Bacillaceae]MBU9721917.1 hypothetical protein [Bacillus alkalicola]